MSRINIAILVLFATLVLAGAAQAQKKIYSWTDKDGITHYSDRAPDPVDAQDTAVSETIVPVAVPEAVNAEDSAAAEPVDTLNNALVAPPAGDDSSYADQLRQEMQDRRVAEEEKQAERRRICLQATDQLARIEPNRRVYYTDDSGETVRMDDEERVRRVEEAKALRAANCD